MSRATPNSTLDLLKGTPDLMVLQMLAAAMGRALAMAAEGGQR
jgi:hypothetical protein